MLRYHVYQLLDGSTGLPFYIGFTVSPKARLWHHRHDARSAAYQRIGELDLAGIPVVLEVLNICQFGREAYDLEAFTIAINVGLVNVARPSLANDRGKPRSMHRKRHKG